MLALAFILGLSVVATASLPFACDSDGGCSNRADIHTRVGRGRGLGGTSSTKNRYRCCDLTTITQTGGWIKVGNISKQIICSVDIHVGGGVSGDHRDGNTQKL